MDYVSGWCRSARRLNGVTAIVTGSNTGIGKETAEDLYLRGAQVILACRNTDKANACKIDIEERNQHAKAEGSLEVYKLDLCSLKSVQDFANKVSANAEKIQILVNNAGVMMCPESRTENGFETHIGSNHFGHAYLTLLLLPKLIKSAPSRIVNVSSYLHARYDIDVEDLNYEKSKYYPSVAYCKSKTANILFAKGLASKLKEHNINDVTTYSLHPGVIRTEISRHFDSTVGNGATWAFNNLLLPFLKSPKCGAQTTIYCSVDESCADESGLYYSDCEVKAPSKQCQDAAFVMKFWNATLEALKIDPLSYNPFQEITPIA